VSAKRGVIDIPFSGTSVGLLRSRNALIMD
jgi:hypothetical protein